jgi:hypothetical protein
MLMEFSHVSVFQHHFMDFLLVLVKFAMQGHVKATDH